MVGGKELIPVDNGIVTFAETDGVALGRLPDVPFPEGVGTADVATPPVTERIVELEGGGNRLPLNDEPAEEMSAPVGARRVRFAEGDGKVEAIVKLPEGWNPAEGPVTSIVVATGVERAELFSEFEFETAPVGIIDSVEMTETLDDPTGTPVEADGS